MSKQIDIALDLGAAAPPLPEAVSLWEFASVPRPAVCLTWFLLPLCAGVFCFLAQSLPQDVVSKWANELPEGPHVLRYIFAGGFAGATTCGLGAGVRMIFRGELLLQSDGKKLGAPN